MAFKDMIKHGMYVGKQRYRAFVDENGWQAQVTTIGLVVVLVVFGGYWLYKKYSLQSEQNAQRMFMGCMDMVNRAEENPHLWQNVEQVCDQYALEKSVLRPYFIAYKAEALIKQGKLADAAAALDQAIPLMKDPAIAMLFKTKRALVRMDSADQAEQQKGLKDLEELAYDAKNPSRDMALYYVGLYYWRIDDREHARKAWKELEAISPREDNAKVSPWALLVKADQE